MNIPMPDRIARLPRDSQQRPIPFFVAWRDELTKKPTRVGIGKPDHRFARPEAQRDAVKFRKCWICGDTLGAFMIFSIGPMCLVTGVSADPPAHLDCAEFAVKACPFLARPSAHRRKTDMPENTAVAGHMIERNPGVTLLWSTKKYKVLRLENDRVLFQFGKPEQLRFYREGRAATRAEILESIDSGLPILRARAQANGELSKLEEHVSRAMAFVPETP